MADTGSEFSVLVQAKFDESSIGTLKSQIQSALKNSPIEIALDTSKVNSQLGNLKSQIKNSNNVKLGIDLDIDEAEKEAKTVTRAFRDLMNIKKEIATRSKKAEGLETNYSKNIEQIEQLREQIKLLRSEEENIFSNFGEKFNDNQLHKLELYSQKVSRDIELIQSKVADANINLSNSIANKFNIKSNDIENIKTKFDSLEHKTDSAKKAMQEFNQAVENVNIAKQGNDIEKLANAYNQYEIALKKVKSEMKDVSNKNSLEIKKESLSSDIDVWLHKNNKAVKQFGAALQRLKQELKSADDVRLNGIKHEFSEIKKEAELADVATQTFGSRLKEKFASLSSYVSASTVIAGAGQVVREMFENVKNIDSAFTELKKVTNETDESYSIFLNNATDKAKELGTSVADYIASTADFARMDNTFADAQILSEVANIYNVVGDDMEGINEASQSIISTMKAFGIEAKNAIGIVDELNNVSNNYSVTSGGLGRALERSAASMANSNTTLEEGIGMITAANTVIQDEVRVGNGLKSLLMNFTSSDKLTKLFNLTGVNGKIDENKLKKPIKILEELAEKWETLNQVQKADTLELMAGKHQSNVLSSLLLNFNTAKEVIETASNSEGSAMEEFEKYMDSLNAKLKRLEATFESLSTHVMDSGFVKGAVDGANSLLNILDSLIEKIGLFPTLIGGLSVGLSLFKNKGFFKVATDVDTLRSKITFLNKDIKDIGASIKNVINNFRQGFSANGLKGGFESLTKNGNGILTNLFASKEDIEAIKNYNNELKNCQSSQTAFMRTMQSASPQAQTFVQSMNGSTASVKQYGKSLAALKIQQMAVKASTIALNAALSVGLSLAIQFAIDTISSMINKQKEQHEQNLKIAQSAKQESDSIIETYNAYNNAKSAYDSNTGSKEQLQSATNDLLSALGVESQTIDELVKKYGSLDNAINNISQKQLKQKIYDLKDGLIDVGKELVNASENAFWDEDFDTLYLRADYDDKIDVAKKIEKIVKKNGLEYSKSNTGHLELLRVDFAGNDNPEEARKTYEQMVKLRDSIRDNLTEDELKQSIFYSNLTSRINQASDKYKEYIDYINTVNKTAALYEYNDYVNKNGVPKSAEEYKNLHDSIINSSKANSLFTGTEKEKQKAIEDTLSTIPVLKDLANGYAIAVVNVANAENKLPTTPVNDLKESADEATASLSKLNEILNKQSTGHSLTYDDYSALEEYSSALEYTNGVMQINAEKARELAKANIENKIATNENEKANRELSYARNLSEIAELNNQIITNTNLSEAQKQEIQSKVSALEAENQGYLNDINSLDVLNASLRESISAYQEWKNAQSAAESGDMFDDAVSAMQIINDTLNNESSDIYGRIGRQKYKTSLDFVIPSDVDSEDEDAVRKYLKSVGDLFIKDENGAFEGLNLGNFIDEAMDKGLIEIDKKSGDYKVAANKTIADFANALHLSIPMIQSAFGELEEIGFKFDFNISETIGEEIIKTDVKIQDLQKHIDKLKSDKKAGIKIDTSELKRANEELKDLIDKRDELSNKNINNIIDYSNLKSQRDSYETAKNAYQAQYDSITSNTKQDIQQKVEIKAKIDDFTSKIKKVDKELDEIGKPTEIELRLATAQIDEQIAAKKKELEDLEKNHPEITPEVKKARKDQLEKDIKTLEDNKVLINTAFNLEGTDEAEKQAKDTVDNINDEKVNDKEFNVKANGVSEAINQLNTINHYKLLDKSYTITRTEKVVSDYGNPVANFVGSVSNAVRGAGSSKGKSKFKGTAKVKGTAKAKGDWGNKEPGKTLVGELGQELWINKNTGRWQTVGDNGAEFINLKKGDIIFNHEQTEQLLTNGFVASRGLALARGNAGDALAGGSYSKTYVSGRGNSDNINRFIKAQKKQIKEYAKETAKETVKQQQKASKVAANKSKSASKKSNLPSNDSSTEKKGKTVLEKFKDWMSKFFDWIEIRINRQKTKVDNYTKKAETYKEIGKYGKSANNYTKTINATSTQLSLERTAVSKYNKQANKVINKAVSDGLITKKQSKSIKNRVRNGTMDISKYGEKVREVIASYQTWAEKAMEASNAIFELHNNIRTYVKSLKEMRDAQREVRLQKIENKKSLAENRYTYKASSKNDQLNYLNKQINAKDSAYSDEVEAITKDSNKIGKTAKVSLKKALRTKTAKGKSKKSKNYRKALKKAQKLIKQKREIPDSVLKVIKASSISVYNKLYAYNLSLDNIENIKLEQALNKVQSVNEKITNKKQKYANIEEEINNDINLFNQRVDNAEGSKNKNSILNNVIKKYESIVSNDKNSIKEFGDSIKSNQNTISNLNKNKKIGTSKLKNLNKKDKKSINNFIKNIVNIVKNGKSISAENMNKLTKYYSDGYISESFYMSCANYNSVIEAKEEALKKKEIDDETLKQQKIAIAQEKFQNVEQDLTNKINENNAKHNKLNAEQTIKTTRGVSLTIDDYRGLLKINDDKQNIYNNGISSLKAQIKSNLDSGFWTTSTQEYRDALNSISNYQIELLNCQNEQEDLNNKIAQLPFDTYDKAIELLDSFTESYKSYIELEKDRGNDLAEIDYTIQINYNDEKITDLTNKLVAAQNELYKALSSPDRASGGKTYEEWSKYINEINVQINNIKADNESIKDQLRDDVYWRTFERSHDAANRLKTVLSGIADLMSDDMFFDKDGKITAYGILQTSNLIKQYENARDEVENYSKDIQNLDKLYNEGQYTQEEYKKKLNEIQDGLFNSASAMKSYINEIVELNKKADKSELDSLLKLIDKRKEALQKKKEYYEFDKTIKNKTQDIQNIKSQIAALESLSNADFETKVNKAKLEADLKERQEDLDDTIKEHAFDLSTEALDELKEILQDQFDDRWDNVFTDLDAIKNLMDNANTLVNAQTSVITDSVNKLLDFYGIDSVNTNLGYFGKYANGSKNISKNQVAWTQENGSEIIIRKSDGAILTPLYSGDSVIPNNLSNNLYEWGKTTPKEFMNELTKVEYNIPISKEQGTNITQNYGSLLTVEGNVDSTVIKDLNKFAQQFYKGSYDYTIREIARDARKRGIKV